MIMESGPQRVRFFVAQDRQADACSHADPFAGRKNMEHDSAECSRAKSSRSHPTRLSRALSEVPHEWVFAATYTGTCGSLMR